MRPEMYAIHAKYEDAHWWYVARRRIVLDIVRTARSGAGRQLRILDVGCGAGGLLTPLSEFATVVGVDPSPIAVAHAAAHTGVDVRLGSLPDRMPFTGSERFDVITALDVIEHVDDDIAALSALRRLLAPGGLLIVTVPAYAFLWSGHDTANEHRRRYTRRMLRTRLVAAGFDVHSDSYFNTVLFPFIAGIRLVRRVLGANDGVDVGAVPEPLNSLLGHLFASERHVLKRMALPFGVSVIATAGARMNKGAT